MDGQTELSVPDDVEGLTGTPGQREDRLLQQVSQTRP